MMRTSCGSSTRWRCPGVDDSSAAASSLAVVSRLAQWHIPDLGDHPYLESGDFVFGFWKWHLAVARGTTSTQFVLFPVVNLTFYEKIPSATFVLRVFPDASPRRPLIKAAGDEVFKTHFDVFVWVIPQTFSGPLIVDVEFLDLKIWSKDDDDEHPSISGWPSHDEGLQPANHQHCGTLGYLPRMLTEGINTDVTISTPDGSLGAHRAVLVSASPVFESMFAYDCKENQTSTIEMTDISYDACSALLRYIYGTLTPEELWSHRTDLLASADKYFMHDLKGRCEESLMEDVSSGNVFERLAVASIRRLGRLEAHCLTYLFDLWKIHDVWDVIDEFLKHAEDELVREFARRSRAANVVITKGRRTC